MLLDLGRERQERLLREYLHLRGTGLSPGFDLGADRADQLDAGHDNDAFVLLKIIVRTNLPEQPSAACIGGCETSADACGGEHGPARSNAHPEYGSNPIKLSGRRCGSG